VNLLKKALSRKNYILDTEKLKSAQKAIGAKTETETIHRALEMATNEMALARALKGLLDRGKGHVTDVFSEG
jgi:hypothetical protein